MDLDPAYLEHEQKAEIRAGRGTLIGRVAIEKRTVEIADAWNDPEYAEKEQVRVGRVRAMLGVPLMRNGELIGAFALGRPARVPFTKRQVELVTTFADQAVIAIESARLFDEVQARTRDLEEALAAADGDGECPQGHQPFGIRFGRSPQHPEPNPRDRSAARRLRQSSCATASSSRFAPNPGFLQNFLNT